MSTVPPAVAKPSRSDNVLDVDQQLLIYNQARAQFDALAPKRPIKPNRSEPEPGYIPSETQALDEDAPVPELQKFRSLQHHSQAVVPQNTPATEQEEFVETEYYKALDAIDKQHHTTGTGFIKAGLNNNYDLELKGCLEDGGKHREMTFKSNPATNDWTPKFDNHQGGFISAKPNRSETS